jgi:hypothetical protein
LLNFSTATGFGTLTTYNGGGGIVGTPQSIAGSIISLDPSGASFIIT